MNTQSPPVTASKRRGRPRDPERVARVLEAASTQFTELGYERASVDAIAAACGISKVTIYSYFPTKAALFQASVAGRVARDFSTVNWPALDPKNPRQALTDIGGAFLSVMRSPDVIKLHRTLYGAQTSDGAVAEGFFAAGPMQLVSGIAGYLREADRSGTLRVQDPMLAADQFLSLFLGLGQIRGLLGLQAPSHNENEALLTANVELFLNGLAR